MVDVINLAYWAGIIDGEGCVSGYKSVKDGRMTWTGYVGISHTNLQLLEDFKSTFHLKDRILPRKKKNPIHKQSYQIRAFGKEAANLLSSIFPFLRLKKSQTKLVLQLTDLRYKRNKHKERENILKEIHELNRRGIQL